MGGRPCLPQNLLPNREFAAQFMSEVSGGQLDVSTAEVVDSVIAILSDVNLPVLMGGIVVLLITLIDILIMILLFLKCMTLDYFKREVIAFAHRFQ